MEALYDYHFGKIKTRKKSLSKENEKKNRFKEEKEAPTILSNKEKKTLPKATKALGFSVDSLTSCSSADHFPPLTLMARVLPLPLFLASLPIPELNCTERDEKKKKKKKKPVAMRCFSREIEMYCCSHQRSCFLLVCGFIRRDNLRAWHDLFMNLTS